MTRVSGFIRRDSRPFSTKSTVSSIFPGTSINVHAWMAVSNSQRQLSDLQKSIERSSPCRKTGLCPDSCRVPRHPLTLPLALAAIDLRQPRPWHLHLHGARARSLCTVQRWCGSPGHRRSNWKAREAFLLKWKKQCPGVAASLKEAGDHLLTF